MKRWNFFISTENFASFVSCKKSTFNILFLVLCGIVFPEERRHDLEVYKSLYEMLSVRWKPRGYLDRTICLMYVCESICLFCRVCVCDSWGVITERWDWKRKQTSLIDEALRWKPDHERSLSLIPTCSHFMNLFSSVLTGYFHCRHQKHQVLLLLLNQEPEGPLTVSVSNAKDDVQPFCAAPSSPAPN